VIPPVRLSSSVLASDVDLDNPEAEWTHLGRL